MGGRYVYLIFYGTPIFFRGVCARYDSGIHFPIALYKGSTAYISSSAVNMMPVSCPCDTCRNGEGPTGSFGP